MSEIRVYGKLIDRSGQPAWGVGVVLTELLAAGKRVLGSSVSDSNGGFSLPYNKPSRPNGRYELQLSVNDAAIPLQDLSEVPGPLYGPHTFVVDNRPPSDHRAIVPRNPLVIPETDLVNAFKQNPGLFTRGIPAREPNPCNPYAPNDLPSRVFYLSQLAVFPALGRERDGRQVTDPVDPSLPVRQLGRGLRYGAVIEFRQEWWDYGQAVGDLLYSVPLAPCEQTKIASVDWRRRDYATQATALDESHTQDTTISRDQHVDETVRLISDKRVDASGQAGGVSATIGPFSGGYSASGESMHEVVDAKTAACRNVNDRVHQASNTVRNTRSFAVAEVTEEEQSVVRTRVIRNHNHCHTVTFQYYQVLQTFLLRTLVNQIRPAVLVPFGLLTFDENALAKHGYILRRALIDTTLAQRFDDYLGIRAKDTTPAPDAPSDPAPEPEATRATNFRVTLSQTAFTSLDNGQLDLVFDAGDDVELRWQPGLSSRQVGTPVRTPAERDLSGIRRIGLQADLRGPLVLDDIVIEAEAAGKWREIASIPTLELAPGRRFVQHFASPVTGPGPEPETTLDTSRLLAHLSTNAAYYTASVIAGGDPNLRLLALADLVDTQGKNIVDIVDNVVVGTFGNYLAFPLRQIGNLPAPYYEGVAQDELKQVSEAHERLITLPTPGVFAESQLGTCSACETIDDTRFWNWQTSPCPDEAPDITEGMLASRYQNASGLVQVVKSDLEPKPIQVPTLPEPMIKIGDETMKELVKGLDLKGSQDVLALIKGLAEIGSEHSLEVFKQIWGAYTRKPGGPGSGTKDEEGDGKTSGGAEGGQGLKPVNGV